MKELQIEWNWSAAMDLCGTDKIRMLSDTYVFDNVNKYTMTTRSKTSMFE